VSQTVKGRVVDHDSKEPLVYVNVVLLGTNSGTTTDSTGSFQLDVVGNDSLLFSYFGYMHHRIHNIHSGEGPIELGDIALVYKGGSGYAMYKKRRFLSKKTRSVCKRFDDTREVTEADLMVLCPNGLMNYKWTRVDDRTLVVDYLETQNCD
jgi:hypothetical protein